MDWGNYPQLAVAAVVAVLGVGRLSRLITYDAWPPSAWVRLLWANLTTGARFQKIFGTGWDKLFFCQWCMTPWLMLGCVLWGVGTGLGPVWWIFWGTLALAYVASMVVVRDEPSGEE